SILKELDIPVLLACLHYLDLSDSALRLWRRVYRCRQTGHRLCGGYDRCGPAFGASREAIVTQQIVARRSGGYAPLEGNAGHIYGPDRISENEPQAIMAL